MRIFVGYGYNPNDEWIERDVFPILEALGLEIVHGKDMYGETLADAVKERIEQSDAMVSFCTLRPGQENAEFNTHSWVRDEMVHAIAVKKLVVEVRQNGVNLPSTITGERQRIPLDPNNKLRCIAEVIKAVNSWSIRKLLLVPSDQRLAKVIIRAVKNKSLIVRYRSRIKNKSSKQFEGRLELVDNGLYLNAMGLPDGSLVEIEGTTNSDGTIFNTGWASADLVRIEFS